MKIISIDYEEKKVEIEKAILFVIESDEIWIPISEIRDDDEDNKIVTIPVWLADKNNIDYLKECVEED
jgi:hypothetical protein